jgi:uncharacterized membrane protein YphA (DoxX/SURF4 family)
MRSTGFGHVLFGISVAGLALLNLAYGNFAPLWEPLPAWLPWPLFWVYGSGAMLLAASAGLYFARTAPVSALLIGAYGLMWAVVRMHAAVLDPRAVVSWYGICEALGPLLGAWILHSVLRHEDDPSAAMVMTGARALRVARILFGMACAMYGIAHFAYAGYTAAMVPAWLPGPTALAYLTGGAHVAAGLGLMFGILPRLAATLEAVMMSLFGVLVWLPSFFAKPPPDWATPPQNQWSETVVTFLLAASAWIVAASLRGGRWGFAPTVPDESAAPT